MNLSPAHPKNQNGKNDLPLGTPFGGLENTPFLSAQPILSYPHTPKDEGCGEVYAFLRAWGPSLSRDG
eukprot:scaffold18373_cov154-Amphora_coffeaeformis.AAC.8